MGTVSEYASEDGEYHRYETPHAQALQFAGTWAASEAHTLLRLTQLTYPHSPDQPVTIPDLVALTCWTVTGPTLPLPILACQPEGYHPSALAEDLTVPAGAADADGRYPGMDPRTPDHRWLLLGPGPGLEVRWDETDNRTDRITLTALPATTPP